MLVALQLGAWLVGAFADHRGAFADAVGANVVGGASLAVIALLPVKVFGVAGTCNQRFG
jgi:hypothetical protein